MGFVRLGAIFSYKSCALTVPVRQRIHCPTDLMSQQILCLYGFCAPAGLVPLRALCHWGISPYRPCGPASLVPLRALCPCGPCVPTGLVSLRALCPYGLSVPMGFLPQQALCPYNKGLNRAHFSTGFVPYIPTGLLPIGVLSYYGSCVSKGLCQNGRCAPYGHCAPSGIGPLRALRR